MARTRASGIAAMYTPETHPRPDFVQATSAGVAGTKRGRVEAPPGSADGPATRNARRLGDQATGAAVELPGIEPGSSVESAGLLRVQFAMSLLGSLSHANKPR